MSERMIRIPSCFACKSICFNIEHVEDKIAGHLKCDEGVYDIYKDFDEINTEFKDIVRGKIPESCPLPEVE